MTDTGYDKMHIEEGYWRIVWAIYACGNMLIHKLFCCSHSVKCQLFKSYLCNLYCGHLWNIHSSKSIRQVKVAYNNVLRSILSLKRDCSISKVCVDNNIHTFSSLQRTYINSFNIRLLNCDNLLVYTMIRSTYFMNQSKLFAKWTHLTHLFDGWLWYLFLFIFYILSSVFT